MTNDPPGPLGWTGRHPLSTYRRSLQTLTAFGRWAAEVGLQDPAAGALWLALGIADLNGRPVTPSQIRQQFGVTRYRLDQAIHKATTRSLIVAMPHHDARQRAYGLTGAGRTYLISILDKALGDDWLTVCDDRPIF